MLGCHKDKYLRVHSEGSWSNVCKHCKPLLSSWTLVPLKFTYNPTPIPGQVLQHPAFTCCPSAASCCTATCPTPIGCLCPATLASFGFSNMASSCRVPTSCILSRGGICTQPFPWPAAPCPLNPRIDVTPVSPLARGSGSMVFFLLLH